MRIYFAVLDTRRFIMKSKDGRHCFADITNKERSRMMAEKLIYIGFSSHDCEVWWECPHCGKKFGDYNFPPQRENEVLNCPYCKEEVRR